MGPKMIDYQVTASEKFHPFLLPHTNEAVLKFNDHLIRGYFSGFIRFLNRKIKKGLRTVTFKQK